MKNLKPIAIKKLGKQDRERKVLLGLVEYYIQTGKPVGSNTLKETGFDDLSSATIRNYFAHLEEAGFLLQSHSSGGRVPTPLAYRTYAQSYLDDIPLESTRDPFTTLREFDSREIALLMQKGAELLSIESQCAVFLTAPRFDQDYIVDIKLVSLDAFRCLCVLISDFGVVQTEILHLPKKLSAVSIKRIEGYFHSRLANLSKPDILEPEEEAIGKEYYNELMLRYIVGYSNFIDEDIYRTGFSRLLVYPDFQETSMLASGLALFENVHSMRRLLKECKALDRMKFWIGDDLSPYADPETNCSVIATPYYINHKVVGAVGLLGPMRLPYRALFSLLRLFSDSVSETLTRNLYKFKINYRQPEPGKYYVGKEEHQLIGQSRIMLLEDKGL